jgi:hypothetical protein
MKILTACLRFVFISPRPDESHGRHANTYYPSDPEGQISPNKQKGVEHARAIHPPYVESALSYEGEQEDKEKS